MQDNLTESNLSTVAESQRDLLIKDKNRAKLNELSRKQEGRDDEEDGEVFENIEQMWEQRLKGDKDKNWYQKSVVYWDEQPATADGVLGGYEVVHEPDSQTSVEMI